MPNNNKYFIKPYMRILLIAFYICCLPFSVKAVKDSVMFRDRRFRLGLSSFAYPNLHSKYNFSNYYEIGYMTTNPFRNKPMLVSHHSDNNGIFISNKNYYTLGAKIDFTHNVKGGYIGYTSGGLVAYGANLNYFNEKNKYDFFGIKPMVGCVYKNYMLFYGYNIKLYGNTINYIPKHSVSVAYFIPLKTKEKIERKKKESKFIQTISKPRKWLEKWIKFF